MHVHVRPDVVSVESPPQNLWNKALDILGAELRDSLDLGKLERGDVLHKALREVKKKRQICIQKCWTFKKPNGQNIILRDVVEKIVVWVEKFVSAGDAATQYDPAHAAPAWAAFRSVLQMAVNDRRAFGEVVENLETVSRVITRHAILEELYLLRYPAARNKLEDLVVHLYAEILAFLAKARKCFQISAKMHSATSIIKFPGDEQMAKINVFDGQLSSLSKIFAIELQVDAAKEVRAIEAILTSLSEPVKRTLDSSSISTKRLEENQRLQFLHWLSPVPFASHHLRYSESRMPGSGQWLLDNNGYLNWRNSSSSSIFLLHGSLGSGKTSLASAVVDSFLQGSSGQASSTPLAYFYCTKNSAEPERRSPDEVMRSVLRQLTVSQVSSSTVHERVLRKFESLQEVAKTDGFGITRLEIADCVGLILDTTAANPAVIVLDAVDEIDPSSRQVLLSALNQIVLDSLNVVKIFVTGRDDSNLRSMLPDAVALRIEQAHSFKDMAAFVHQEITSAIQNQKILKGFVSHNLEQDLISGLTTSAGEMFVRVVRQIENISRLKTGADIRNMIRVFPEKTLNELYEEDFRQISRSGQHTRSCALHIFSMLLCAREALSPEALIQMIAQLASQQGETVTFAKMIEICMNLVVLDSELDVVRFAHISFQEFLESKAEFAPQSIHRLAAKSCLEFCIEGLPRGMKMDITPKKDFHCYSAIYWADIR